MLINGEEHNDLCVGIDLGTTNSVLATINLKANGDIVSKVVDLPRAVDVFNSSLGRGRLNTQKRSLLPSCVYYREEYGYEPLVGDFAKNQFALRPHLVAKSIKSQMGKAQAEGLAQEIMDKTPAQVSARILKHMLKEAGKIYRTEITDAVITVPANFDSVMCQATREAAAMAGIKVTDSDGSERAVLLSEPNAVIYDLINQVQNGEISNHIIDLNSEKNVMVFDLGGGTLDITMHKIKRREDYPDILKVDEIATNRYTLLGGDDFDAAIAAVMFEHYQKQYATYPEIVHKLQQEKKAIMPQLINYAEALKLDVSERAGSNAACSDDDMGWGDDEEEFVVGGNMGGIGYAYDDSFTKEDIEAILAPFMGNNLQFDDYKNLDTLNGTRNIIYPVLDVLYKSSTKLGDGFKVDAVIVNGGMSKFYMVTKRLEEFFGFEPIVALDPDQAVARGAAVYHYYLHKHAQQMQEDMRLVGAGADKAGVLPTPQKQQQKAQAVRPAIEWGNKILNDSLYLGMRDGAVRELIPGGTTLPYQSDFIKGFQLLPGKGEIAIPIKRRNLGKGYQTIGNGRLKLQTGGYADGAYVAIRVKMNASKVITMEMQLSRDYAGHEVWENKVAEIVIGSLDDGAANKIKMVAPLGGRLDVVNELHGMQLICERSLYAKGNRGQKAVKMLAQYVTKISAAANKDEFAEPILNLLKESNNDDLRQRLLLIARRHAASWTEIERRKLARECMNLLQTELKGFECSGSRVNTNIQAIYTLACCGSSEQIADLVALKRQSRYYSACLYAFGKKQQEGAYIYDCFALDAYAQNKKSNLQTTAHALAMALRLDTGCRVKDIDVKKVIKDLCFVINNRTVYDERYCSDITCCILALGYACDQRFEGNVLPQELKDMVAETFDRLPFIYPTEVLRHLYRIIDVSGKMFDGQVLSHDDEEFLLQSLEI